MEGPAAVRRFLTKVIIMALTGSLVAASPAVAETQFRNTIALRVPGPFFATQGEQYTFVVTVQNLDSASREVFFRESTAPQYETVNGAVPSQGSCDILEAYVWCPLGSLEPGAAATVSITATPNRIGSIGHTLEAISSSEGGSGTFITYFVASLDPGSELPPDVRVAADAPLTATTGGVMTYIITATNVDSRPALGFMVWVHLNSAEFLSATSHEGTCAPPDNNLWVVCTFGDLPGGESGALSIEMIARSETRLWLQSHFQQDWLDRSIWYQTAKPQIEMIPDSRILSGPEGAVASRDAAFTFTASEYFVTFECSLDGGPYESCTSPHDYSDLADGSHKFWVRATDGDQNTDPTPAERAWVVDTIPPAIPTLRGLDQAFQRQRRLPLGWTATDSGSGVARYDVRYRRAPWNGGFGSWVLWQKATRLTGAVFWARPGSTYCFAARARDAAGNVSPWSENKCSAFPVDDRALAASQSFVRAKGPGNYLGTFTSSRTRGASLTVRGVRAKSLALLATRCPTCGTVIVSWNGRPVARVSLWASVTKKKQLIWLKSFSSVRSGKVTIVIVSKGRPARIDGLGISRL